DKIHRRCITE
ncbi:unnamed protein product, partial [Rotaria sp. Silwood1]